VRRLLALPRLARDDRGATIVEFAIILPVLCILLMGTFDLGYRSYVISMVQGSLHEAARMATVGGTTTEEIQTHVEGRLQDFSRNATIETSTQSFRDFNGIGSAEPLTEDADGDGQYDEDDDCYRDNNFNGEFDSAQGSDGMGSAEDAVRFRVQMTYPRMFPMAGLLGWSDEVEIVQSTVLRNQPWAARTEAPEICPEN
jgi:Flp pilus assembly pilin Flp